MSRKLFEARLAEAEGEVSRALERLGSRQGVDDPLAFAARHRELASLLSLARHRRYDQSLVARLNARVVRAHAAIHHSVSGRAIRRGLATLLFDFPRAVRASPRALAAAALCFFGSYLAVAIWLLADPDAAYAVLPAEHLDSLGRMYDPFGEVQATPRDVTTDLGMFGFYVWNNVGIAFRTFGSGLFLGAGSIFVLLFNGVVIGASHAHVVNLGYADSFHGFVAGHAAFELFAIVLSGVAGLRVGLALVAPGLRTRREALILRAREVRPLLWGSFAMLLVAAAIEAFFSPRDLPLGVSLGFGGANALGLALFFTLSGRSRAAR